MTPSANERPVAAAPEHTVLIVDDSVIDRHLAGAIVQKLEGWKASLRRQRHRSPAAAQASALPDLVLTDMLMPEMDGLELVQAIRNQYPLLPVILMTAHGSEDIAIQALQRGAASYVPKKSLARDLAETMEQVLAAGPHQHQASSRSSKACRGMRSSSCWITTCSWCRRWSAIWKTTSCKMKLCEPAGLILLGVALHEALTNAIFHGNLELSSAIKEQDEKKYYSMAVERTAAAALPRSPRLRHHHLDPRDASPSWSATRDPASIRRSLPDPTDPSNLEKVSGRGLLLIQTFMDHVEHNDRGNQITMVKRRT